MLGDLSVIIPNYNHSMYLQECFKRLKSQTQLPKEIIIIDDGSKDNSVSIIENEVVKIKNEHPSISVTFIKNKKNKGVIYSENLGVKKSKQNNVYFLSVDDTIESEFFKKSLDALSEFPNAGMCSAIVKVQNSNDQFVYNPINLPSKKTQYITPQICRKILYKNDFWTGGNSCIYRRSVFISLGGFREEFHGFCDIYLAMSVVAKYGCVFIPKHLTTFKIYETSYSSSYYTLEKLEDLQKIYKMMIKSFADNHPDYFKPKLLNSLEERNITKLNLIYLKKKIDEGYNLLTKRKLKNINFFTNFINYSYLASAIVYIFLFSKIYIKNMIINMIKIKFKQKLSLITQKFYKL